MNTNTKVPKLISHPFLLLRLVVFVILLLLNVLILSFAASNITVSRTWEGFVTTGPSLAVFNSSVFLFLFMLLLGEHKFSHAIPPVSMVLAEAGWTNAMAVLTFASSVLSTRHGPTVMCSPQVNSVVCSSSILLLPVSWMNFFLLFGYSVTLLIVTIVHAPLVPDIWHSNISEIPWFAFSASSVSRITYDSEKADLEGQTVYGDAFHSDPEIKHDREQTLKSPPRPPWQSLPRGSLTISVASFTPAWAKKYNAGLTRGLHNPFDTSTNEGSSDSVQRPARVITKPTHEGRFHEGDDDPFASASKHDIVTTKIPDDYNDKKRSLQPLAGFGNLPQWSTTMTSGEIDRKDTGKHDIGMLMVRNPLDRTSNTTTTTTTAVHLSPFGRRSVSSLFPHDVREEDWNLPLTKPPFRNGRGEGWTTAAAN